MITIYKYPLKVTDGQTVTMPAGAELLSVQVQNGIACLWAKVDTGLGNENRIIHIYGTGHPIENGLPLKYISTFQTLNGELVFHAFEQL